LAGLKAADDKRYETERGRWSGWEIVAAESWIVGLFGRVLWLIRVVI
jgi:hypothetical protein